MGDSNTVSSTMYTASGIELHSPNDLQSYFRNHFQELTFHIQLPNGLSYKLYKHEQQHRHNMARQN